MSSAFLAHVELGPSWQRRSGDKRSALLRYGSDVEVGARRSVDGWLRDAYPVSHDDVELYASDRVDSQALVSALSELAQAILAGDGQCRRVVFAAAAGDEAVMSAARAAGFRYVLDVDVPGAELSLLVAEPDWVTNADADLDAVPES
ncbi:MAG: hypothetical protein M3O32_10035 [Actinomycetota bacterium]|nr:hypothetical protein [Actinomycetota bacterium]